MYCQVITLADTVSVEKLKNDAVDRVHTYLTGNPDHAFNAWGYSSHQCDPAAAAAASAIPTVWRMLPLESKVRNLLLNTAVHEFYGKAKNNAPDSHFKGYEKMLEMIRSDGDFAVEFILKSGEQSSGRLPRPESQPKCDFHDHNDTPKCTQK